MSGTVLDLEGNIREFPSGGGSFPTYTQTDEPTSPSEGDSWVRPVGGYPDGYGVGLLVYIDGQWRQAASVRLDEDGHVTGFVTVGEDGNIILARVIDTEDVAYIFVNDSQVRLQHRFVDGEDVLNSSIRLFNGVVRLSSDAGQIDHDEARATNLADPEDDQDATTKTYVDAAFDDLEDGIAVKKTTLTVDAEVFNNASSTPIEIAVGPDDPSKVIHVLSIMAQKYGGTIRYGADASEINFAYAGEPDSDIVEALTGFNTSDDQVFIQPLLNAKVFNDPSDIADSAIIAKTGFDAGMIGAIDESSKATGGADYEVGDTFTVAPVGEGDNAEGEVDTVNGSGAVLTYHLTSNGSGFFVGAGNATVATSGTGTGFEIDIDSITPPDWSWRFTTIYEIFELGGGGGPG